MPRLIVMSSRGATRQVSLRDATTTIGRGGGNGIVLESNHVSRRHAVLIRNGGAVMVRDLASSNGTHVNEERIAWRVLQHGDVIEIGDFKLRFLSPTATRDAETLALDLTPLMGDYAAAGRAPLNASAGWR